LVSKSDFRLSRKTPPLVLQMVPERHRLLATLMFEDNDRPVSFLLELETYFCAEPLYGSVDRVPEYPLLRDEAQEPSRRALADIILGPRFDSDFV
jgi:hypothetical protein